MRLLRFCFSTLSDWFEKLAPRSEPIRCQTKTNRNLVTRVFLRLAPVTCICFEFWLVPRVVFVCCDWPEGLLWFWFYYTQLKTALVTWTAIRLTFHVLWRKYYKPLTRVTAYIIGGFTGSWWSQASNLDPTTREEKRDSLGSRLPSVPSRVTSVTSVRTDVTLSSCVTRALLLPAFLVNRSLDLHPF